MSEQRSPLLNTQGLLEGLEVFTRNWQDTKIIAYLATNSTAGNVLGLKALAHEFAGNWAKDDIKDIRKIPLKDLLQYNLVDALATHYVRDKYYPIMVADQQEALYIDLMLPSQKLLIQMELTGMPMSAAKVQEIKAKLESIRDQHLSVIQNSKLIAAMALLLQDSLWEKDFTTRQTKAKNPSKIQPKDKTAFAGVAFNPNSGPQLQRLLYELMGLPIIDRTDTKQPATGAETIEKLIHHTQDAAYKELLTALIGYGQVQKILSTFIPAFEQGIKKADDGIIWLHGSFNLGGTVSGRLSSCVASWTRIRTQRGLVPITELHIGDLVWTHNRRWRAVEDIILKPVTPMVDVRFCNGYILTCTMDHKLRLPNGEWKTVKEIINEHIENVDAEPCEYLSNADSVPQRSAPHSGTDCTGSGNDLSQCQPCVVSTPSCSGVSGTQSLALLNLKRRGAQSHERQNTGTASQLDRGMLGRQGLLDHPAQWRTAVCTSGGDGTSLGPGLFTGAFGGTSHRRESTEQCVGQSGFSDAKRAHDSSLASSDVSYGKIAEIYDRGDLPVWDITVTEDHSYWAEGCFNHNSDPNLQNIPANSIYGKLIKESFCAPTGWLFCGADFNSLEDYISALTTKDPNKLKVYTDGFDGHCLRAVYYFREEVPGIELLDINSPSSVNSIKKLFPEWRQESKTPTFALTYQGTYHTLMANLGWSEEKAKRIEASYHDMYRVSDEYVQRRLKQANKDGYVTVAFGLRVRTPLIKQVLWGGSKMPYEAAAEGRTAGNAMGQSYGLLNNRAAVDFWKKVWASKYRYDILPCALIHDAIYTITHDNAEAVEWANRELVKSMQWQELPEIQHPTVKLGANLDIFWPDWAHPTTLPNNADQATIRSLCRQAKEDYLNPKPKKAA